MAKYLPYFQFEPAEYLTGDISFCSLSAQGLFVNICSYYWQRECQLSKEQLLRRLNHENEFNELVNEGVICVEDDEISIKFLDNQFEEINEKSKINSANGKKGGRPKKNPNKTESKPNQNPTKTEVKGIREEKRREEEIKEKESDKEKPTSPSVENVLENIENLKLRYDDPKLKNAICKNMGISEQTLKISLEQFNIDLKSEGRFSETQKEYSRYFLNCIKSGKYPKQKTKKFKSPTDLTF